MRNKIAVLFFIVATVIKVYGQDSIVKTPKNAFYVLAIPTINSMLHKNEFNKYGNIKPEFSFSYQFGYLRKLSKKFSTSLNVVIERQKINQENALVTVTVNPFFDPRQNHYPPPYRYEMRSNLKYKCNYVGLNIINSYSIFNHEKIEINYWLGVNYSLVGALEVEGIPEPLPASGTSTSSIYTPFQDAKDREAFFKLSSGLGANFNLTKRFVLTAMPGYQIFLTKSKYGTRFYDISCRVGLGYKW